MNPESSNNEKNRIRELYRLEILDPASEAKFNDIVELASRICNVPFSLISLLEINRQWFTSKVGLETQGTPYEMALCADNVAYEEDFFEIADTRNDKRLMNIPLVKSDPHLRFYASTPLVTSKGERLGSLSVADIRPNHLDENQRFALKALSNQVAEMIELRVANKRMESQLQHLKHENEMQKMMLSIIAHDVRNPIGAIKGVMDFITTNDISEHDKHKLTSMFSEQLDTTLELLNNLVDWSKMQMSKTQAQPEMHNLNSLVENLFKQFKLGAQFKNNKLINLVDKGLLFYVDANIARFILRNLIANSNKFTHDGSITVYAHEEKEQIVLSVSDTGVGISPERFKKLFHKSKHQSTPGTNHEKGSGLGLILTKNFITCLQGTMSIESELGKGTTVFIFLPKLNEGNY